MKKEIALLQCAYTKQPFPAPAYLLYKSTFFRVYYNHAIATKRIPFIISGKYGVIKHDKIIYPYDTILTKNSQILHKIISDIKNLSKQCRVISYLSKPYRNIIISNNNIHIEDAFKNIPTHPFTRIKFLSKYNKKHGCDFNLKNEPFEWIIQYVYENESCKIKDITEMLNNKEYSQSVVNTQIQRLRRSKYVFVSGKDIFYRLQNEKWIDKESQYKPNHKTIFDI